MVRRASVVVGLGLVASCGDPILPADYSGPPASTVTGSVVKPRMDSSKGGEGGGAAAMPSEAHNPRMALAWLDAREGEGRAPIGQPVSYKKTVTIESNTLEIALDNPVAGAKFDLDDGSRARIAVGKVAYYDDRNNNLALDWECLGAHCDVVKSVSAQFLVFVDEPPTCRDGTGLGTAPTRIARGYHTFGLSGGEVVEAAPGAPLELELLDRSPAESNPTSDLKEFTHLLADYFSSTRVVCP